MIEAGESGTPPGTETFVFADDGLIPNNPLPLVLRRGAIAPSAGDPARASRPPSGSTAGPGPGATGSSTFTITIRPPTRSWASPAGSAVVRFGGEGGAAVAVTAGDVVVIPAGVGHARLHASPDLLVVGAYPNGMPYDLIRADADAIAQARRRIAEVPLPETDPVDGPGGPLARLWRGAR
jgi:uncharacterized protein YjlB